jgi:methanogenic corrinoid protein MtbC1
VDRLPPAAQRLVSYVLQGQDEAIDDFVQGLLDEGNTVDDLFLDLLPSVARRLGDLWEEDSCSFMDVTLGVGRMQRLVRRLQPTFLRDREAPADGRAIYLAGTPGEDHTFGLMLSAEFLARAGWGVTMGRPLGGAPESVVGQAWHTAAGFSLAREDGIPALKEAVEKIRSLSLNPSLVVLVGGEVVRKGAPGLDDVGADALIRDAADAPPILDRLTAGM